jgi:hypothetical protein
VGPPRIPFHKRKKWGKLCSLRCAWLRIKPGLLPRGKDRERFLLGYEKYLTRQKLLAGVGLWKPEKFASSGASSKL